MKAWQFTGKHQPLALNDVPEPEPLPGEVLIEIKACGLCHSDLGILHDDKFPPLPWTPITIGHEVAGVIRELGEGITGWAVGDPVIIGNLPTQVPGLHREGGYTSKITARADVLVRKPEGVSFEQAAMSTDAGATAHHAVAVSGQAGPGVRMGIIGLGGLGQIGARVAVLAGCDVHVAEIRPDLWPLAEDLGAMTTVPDVGELASEQLDVIVDFAGAGSTTTGAISAVRAGGRVVQVGMSTAEVTININTFILRRVTLVGSLGGGLDDLESVCELIAGGQLKPITTSIGFDEIPAGLERLERGDVTGRLVARIGD